MNVTSKGKCMIAVDPFNLPPVQEEGNERYSGGQRYLGPVPDDEDGSGEQDSTETAVQVDQVQVPTSPLGAY
ncbi:hypothetical protein CEXT_489341 [Caerostris extrusa]|uniref:Uncharacterized protein n=1 Tax=Caerostris extrusa TaxID=172846 RepID=A0AAV4MQA1_CAEEX|nr:hypothetical protein CEXT_489341 [Caerostris extrusa]